MKFLRRVAGCSKVALATAWVLKAAVPAHAQLPSKSTAPASRPAAMTAKPSTDACINIQIAWLGDPGLFPCNLAAKPMPDGTELIGFVPSESVRQKAVQIARAIAPGKVTDNLKVLQGMSVVSSRPAAPEELAAAATALLSESLGDKVVGLQVSSSTAGQIEVAGNLGAAGDKLEISRCLRQLRGCTHVVNKASAPESPEVAAIAKATPKAATAPAAAKMATPTVVKQPIPVKSAPPVVVTQPAPIRPTQAPRIETPPPPLVVKTLPKPAPKVESKPDPVVVKSEPIKGKAFVKSEDLPILKPMPEVVTASAASPSTNSGSGLAEPDKSSTLVASAVIAAPAVDSPVLDYPMSTEPLVAEPTLPALPKVAPPGAKVVVKMPEPASKPIVVKTPEPLKKPEPIVVRTPEPAKRSSPYGGTVIAVPSKPIELPPEFGKPTAVVSAPEKIIPGQPNRIDMLPELPKAVAVEKPTTLELPLSPSTVVEQPKTIELPVPTQDVKQPEPKIELPSPVEVVQSPEPKIELPTPVEVVKATEPKVELIKIAEPKIELPKAVEPVTIAEPKIELPKPLEVAITPVPKIEQPKPSVAMPSLEMPKPVDMPKPAIVKVEQVLEVPKPASLMPSVERKVPPAVVATPKAPSGSAKSERYSLAAPVKSEPKPMMMPSEAIRATSHTSTATPNWTAPDAQRTTSSPERTIMGVIRHSGSVPVAPVSADAARLAIETACNSDCQDLKVTSTASGQLSLAVRVQNSATWDQLYLKVKSLPEVAGYAVIYNVGVDGATAAPVIHTVSAKPAMPIDSRPGVAPLMGILRGPATTAPASADAVRQSIESACNGRTQSCSISAMAAQQVSVSIKVKSASEWDSLYAKIKQLPEVAGYAVVFNIQVTN